MDESKNDVRFSFLSSAASQEELEDFCHRAQKDNKDYVIVNPFYVPMAKRCLEGGLTKIGVIVDYPSGQSSPQDKAFSASDGQKNGASIIAMIPNLPALQAENYDLLRSEISTVREAIGDSIPLHLVIPISLFDPGKEKIKEIAASFPNSFVSFPSGELFPDCQKSLDALRDEKKVYNLPNNEILTIGEGKPMKKPHHVFGVIAAVLWLLFIGWWLAMYYFIVGILCCITIIFIPVGIQWFKFAKLAFQPFGKDIEYAQSGGKIFLNVLWIIFGGWENALLFYIFGAILCVTIIFIPCGKQFFKFGKLALMPLGAKIVKTEGDVLNS